MIASIISWVFTLGVSMPWSLYWISLYTEETRALKDENKRILKDINDIENYKMNIECEILANDERIRLLKEGY